METALLRALEIAHLSLLLLLRLLGRLIPPVALEISRRVSIVPSRASSSLEIVTLPLSACICARLRCRKLERAAATNSWATSSIDANGHALAPPMRSATPHPLASGCLALAILIIRRWAIRLLGIRWGGTCSSGNGELESRRGPFLLGQLCGLLGFGKGQRVPALMATARRRTASTPSRRQVLSVVSSKITE